MLNIFHDIPLCVPLGTNSRFAVVGSKLDASWNIMKNIQQVCGSVILNHMSDLADGYHEAEG